MIRKLLDFYGYTCYHVVLFSAAGRLNTGLDPGWGYFFSLENAGQSMMELENEQTWWQILDIEDENVPNFVHGSWLLQKKATILQFGDLVRSRF